MCQGNAHHCRISSSPNQNLPLFYLEKALFSKSIAIEKRWSPVLCHLVLHSNKIINWYKITAHNHEWCKTTASHPQPNSTEQEIPICRMNPRNSLKPIPWPAPFEMLPLHCNILKPENSLIIIIAFLIIFTFIYMHPYKFTCMDDKTGTTSWRTKSNLKVRVKESRESFKLNNVGFDLGYSL